jgi:hypothetical protein
MVPTLTALTWLNPEPVIVTRVPPAVLPDAGERADVDGAEEADAGIACATSNATADVAATVATTVRRRHNLTRAPPASRVLGQAPERGIDDQAAAIVTSTCRTSQHATEASAGLRTKGLRRFPPVARIIASVYSMRSGQVVATAPVVPTKAVESSLVPLAAFAARTRSSKGAGVTRSGPRRALV